ncbi:MAG: MotA/TolQ/ExbB proton channel family protein [Deltaproteobacteria bacterium]|nr:MotA/TolQ/ExbB proton channel family protein [Deltaproteobacteria bacterium]
MDPVSLIAHSSGPVFFVIWLLILASVFVWFLAVLKLLQLRRLNQAEQKFEKDAERAADADQLFGVAAVHPDAPGARVVLALKKRRDVPKVLEATANRAVVTEQQRASTMMPTLASIGAASPFVGLFGTVYGIMDAFLRIGREKSASLPVVAPAIGEALIATAIGLFAAIPAVVAYNAISKRIDDLLSALEASADGWVQLAKPDDAEDLRSTLDRDQQTVGQPAPSNAPPAYPGV